MSCFFFCDNVTRTPDIPKDYKVYSRDKFASMYNIDAHIESKFSHIYFCTTDITKFDSNNFNMFSQHEHYKDDKVYTKDIIHQTENGHTRQFYYVLYYIIDPKIKRSNTIYYVAKHEHIWDALRNNMMNQCRCSRCTYNKWYDPFNLFRPSANKAGCIKSECPAQIIINKTVAYSKDIIHNPGYLGWMKHGMPGYQSSVFAKC